MLIRLFAYGPLLLLHPCLYVPVAIYLKHSVFVPRVYQTSGRPTTVAEATRCVICGCTRLHVDPVLFGFRTQYIVSHQFKKEVDLGQPENSKD